MDFQELTGTLCFPACCCDIQLASPVDISRTDVPFCRFAANDAAIVFIFAVIALELKYRAPKAHTMLEM